MKKIILSGVALFFMGVISRGYAQYPSLDEIRHQYYLTTLDYQHAFSLIEILEDIENPSPLQMAYHAATEAVLAKPGWNFFKKLGHLKNSRKLFSIAVEQDVDDLEIRFLRQAVEYHIPKYLGYSRNIQTDKKVIMENLKFFAMKRLPAEIIEYILTFSKDSGIYNREEIDQVREALK